MWIGATQPLEGHLVVSFLCGIGGLWRGSKSVWGTFLLHVCLETSKMVSLELLQGFMCLIQIVIERFYGRTWLA